MTAPSLATRVKLLLRFYGVGIVNTAFGYSLFFLLIAAGLNIYLAQLIGHLIGMTFNYIMFRNHVFTGSAPAIGRYLAAYGVNYLLGLGLIALFSHFMRSPYAVGACAALTASAVNFVVLKVLVFNRAALP
jgi:putative flippase GtrA